MSRIIASTEISPPSRPAGQVVNTICPYCGTGCGVRAQLTDQAQQPLLIAGDEQHPTNYGRLCSKGSNLDQTMDLAARLLYPEVDGERQDWDSALTIAAGRIRQIIDQHGPDAFAIYCSGQLLTEDYYVANKLMKGFIGSANIDTNSRLCMSSTVAGHKRAFGSDTVPGCYEDLDDAELVVLSGSNTAWCHPILFQRIRAAKEANPDRRVVVIDPRRTATCDIADLHLALKPGSDGYLFNGLLCYLAEQGRLDHEFIANHTHGLDDALRAAAQTCGSIEAVASHCQLEVEAVTTFYRWFAETEKTVTTFSQGINQSSSGTDKVNSLINCHLATGRIGKAGMGPLSFTGQPNAMGGREVGGLANQLAAHLELDNPQHRELVSRFWKAPRLATQAGLKAVELFRAIETGQVKGVWIMATNPVDSLPDADRVRDALAGCELVIQSDCMKETDTGPLAHIRFPALGWGEKDGTVTNSERCISRQRAIYPRSGEAHADWWIISQLARKLGFEQGFDYQQVADIFREHAQLSAFENHPQGVLRDFNLAGLADLDSEAYEQLQPVQWPVLGSTEPPMTGAYQGTPRLFGDGRFFTADGRARIIAVAPQLPSNSTSSTYPLVLNTGRIRDQWHTMTRTGLSARLSAHLPEPFVEVNPADAARYQLEEGAIARLQSQWGKMLARVRITDSIGRRQLFVPMHWTAQFASQGRMGPLVNPVVDPLSGQPESKHTPASISPYPGQWYGFVLSRTRLDLEFEYQVRATGQDFHRYELADSRQPADWQQLRQIIGGEGELLEYSDAAQGRYRAARIVDGRLQAVLVIASTPSLPQRDWLGSLFEKTSLDEAERRQLLSGRPPAGGADSGPVVCACFGVGRNTIIKAVAEQQLETAEAIGCALKAGTNCGSCIPELRQLLAR